jgi:hypothetical protein
VEEKFHLIIIMPSRYTRNFLPVFYMCGEWGYTTVAMSGWSELAATNALVEDEPVQPVLWMNILPA